MYCYINIGNIRVTVKAFRDKDSIKFIVLIIIFSCQKSKTLECKITYIYYIQNYIQIPYVYIITKA